MAFKTPGVYPITDTRLSGLSHAEQVKQLISGGATLIQLRDKYLAPSEFYREALMALDVARAQGAQLIINDRVDITLAIKADGVHLGQTDLPPDAARKILGEDAIIGFSTHNLEQARIALDLPVDYLAVGPLPVSKSPIRSSVLMDCGASARRLIGYPLSRSAGLLRAICERCSTAAPIRLR